LRVADWVKIERGFWMGRINQPFRIIAYLLMGIGVLLLGLNFILGGIANIALPLVFLMLGGAFYILVFVAAQRWSWGPVLYIPGSILLALGLVFLLNVITNDWNSWAYAWLLILAGLGLGLVLANREKQWRNEFTLGGWGLIVIGITLFALFGAIAGGLFIQIMAPILLILGGLLLRWLRPDAIFPERILRKLNLAAPQAEAGLPTPDQTALVEPLSGRELEVLRLVDQGLSNPEIAARLSVASSTVKTHINNIYGKLGVQSRVQAVRRARELGLLEV